MKSLLAALFLATALAPAVAQDARQNFRRAGIGPGSELSIRAEPDGAAPVIAAIPWNVRRVRGFGCTSDTPSGHTWCRVKHGGVVGWARRRYLVPAP